LSECELNNNLSDAFMKKFEIKFMVCSVCGLVIDSTSVPENCPACGAPKAKIVLTDED